VNPPTIFRAPKWLLALVAVGLIALGAAGGLLAARAIPELSLGQTSAKDSNTQIVQAVTREQQVVLLSLGIQGIATKTSKSTFLGLAVPGSSRSTFLQYSFQAKLGLEGGQVRVTPTADNSYRVSIPAFTFIGHSDESFQMASEKNGALSWVTPKIDTNEMITALLNDEAQAQYVAQHQSELQSQAESFYSQLISGIDPTATVVFEYVG
jgi:hypothetical protein